MSRGRKEEYEQKALAEWLDWHGILWVHVGHEGDRHPAYANKLKKQGVKPGVPDVLIFDRPPEEPNAAGMAVELKREGGYQSDLTDNQEEWLDKLENRGWITRVAFGADEAIEMIKEFGYG